MKMTDITALGRSIDPRYPTVRAIMLLAVAVAGAGALLHLLSGTSLLESVGWAIGAGLVLFLTWALGRELDPDHDLSAFVGVGLAIIGLWLIETPSLLVVLWLLLVLRLLNRTVGLPARPLDSLGVFGLGAWLAWQGDWLIGLLTAAAFLLDGLLSSPLRYHLVAAALSLVTTAILTTLSGAAALEGGPADGADLAASLAPSVAVAAVAGLFLVVIATSREVRAVGDANGEPLNPRRVQAAQVLALLTALLAAWWDGVSALETLLPLWAAMLGVSLYRLAILFLSRSRRP
jgi:hypothetical protein